MKKYLACLLLLVLSSLAAAQEQDSVPADPAHDEAGSGRLVVDDVAAVVGGEIILSSEIKMEVLQEANDQKVSIYDTLAFRRLSEQVLKDAIAQKVLLHQAKEAKVEISEEELNQMVESQLAELRSGYRSEEDLQRDLAESGQNLAGIKELYREIARERLMGQTFLRNNLHNFPQVKVTEEEARRLFEAQPTRSTRPEQVKVIHMLIAPKPSQEVLDQARAKIDSVYKMYQEGTDFGWLAGKYSEDASASSGGDLGFFSKGEMVKEFETAAFEMKVGEVRIVKTSFGWHLLRVETRRQKEVRARHILAQTRISQEDWENARELAESLRNKVLEGGSFIELTREHSVDANEVPENPPMVEVRQLKPPVVRQALSGTLTPVPGTEHAISEVTEAKPEGYLLVLRMEHKEAAPLTFEEVRGQLIQSLQSNKQVQAFVEKLREKTFVEVRFKDWNPQGGS